jgi:NTE family protein
MNNKSDLSFYAILDGGGVKGAALAGCLAAAEDKHIDFIGYGGTSAGSIVALLAAVGYSGEDLNPSLTSYFKKP